MKPPFLTLAALLPVVACPPAFGQAQLDPVTIPVEITAEYVTEANLCWNDPCGPDPRIAQLLLSLGDLSVDTGELYGETIVGYTGDPYSSELSGTANLKPGKKYQLSIDPYFLASCDIRIELPSGYSVFVEGVERLMISGTTYQFLDFRVESNVTMAAGQAVEPRPGRIVWSVGMGQLRNGDPAGSIQMRELMLTATTYTPAALYYDHSNPDIEVLEQSGVLRHVYANECLADIQKDPNAYEGTHTYWIRFYGRTEVGPKNPNGTYNQTDKSPFVEYKVENPTYPTISKLRITRYWHLPSTRTSWTEITKSGSTWTVVPWNNRTVGSAPDAETRITYANSDKEETIEVRDGGSNVYAKSFNEYKDHPWGDRELYKSIKGYGYSNPLQTTFDYGQTSGYSNYKKVVSKVEPDGYWEKYDYYSNGQIWKVYRPFEDSPTAPGSATDSNCELVTYTYATDFSGASVLPATILTHRNGYLSGKTVISYDNTNEDRNDMPVVVATRNDYWNSGSSVETITRTYRADVAEVIAEDFPTDQTKQIESTYFPGKIHSISHADGSMEAYVYQWGTYNPSNRTFSAVSGGTEFMVAVIHGTTSSSGNVALSSYDGYEISTSADYTAGIGFHLIPDQSTMEATVFSSSGTPIWVEKRIYANSSWHIVDREITAYQGGLAAFPYWKSADSGDPYGNWTTYDATYGEGFLITQETNADGIQHVHTYDELGRKKNQKRTTVTGQPGGGDLWTMWTYDPAGQVTSTWISNTSGTSAGSSDLATSYTYDKAGRVATRVEKVVDGSSPVNAATTYSYFYGGNPRATRELRPDGSDLIRTTCYDRRLKSITGSAEVNKYYDYWAQSDGRLRRQERLSTSVSGDGWHDTYFDWLGRVNEDLKPSPAGGHVKNHYLYNSAGQLYLRQLKDEGWAWIQAAHRWVYDAQGKLIREGMDLDQNNSLDLLGVDRVTTRDEYFEQMSGDWWSTVTQTKLTSTTDSINGVSSTVRTRLTGRTSTLRSETQTTDPNGQVTTEIVTLDRTNCRLTTTTTYPGATNTAVSITVNGLLESETSTFNAKITYLYDNYERIQRKTTRQDASVGDNTYVELEYYPGTRLAKHRKNLYLGGSGFQKTYYDKAGRVTVDEISDSTLWKTKRYAYNSRGQIEYQWGSDLEPVQYVYNGYGWRTAMRTFRDETVNWNAASWPGGGSSYDQTTWSYDIPGDVSGAQRTGVVYSKTDPQSRTVQFRYNKRGQVSKRTWARGVVTNYKYYDAIGIDSDIGAQAYMTGELKMIDYSDSTPDVKYYYNASYGANAWRTGKFNAISDATGGRTFSYRTNDLQEAWEWYSHGHYGVTGGYGRGLWRSYDSKGRLYSMSVGWGNDTDEAVESRYYYGGASGFVRNVAGHRPGKIWRLFTYNYRPGSHLISKIYGYDFDFERNINHQQWRNLIDSVENKWGSTNLATFAYNYDWAEQNINRTITGSIASQRGGSSLLDDYELNAKGEVIGADAQKGLWNGSSWVDRLYDWGYDAQGNREKEKADGGSWSNNTINSLNQITYSGATHTYDLDGNLTNDGTWAYSYDAENRMISAIRNDSLLFTFYTYDYMGRRVRIETRNVTLTLIGDIRIAYDGWHPVAEFDAMPGGTAYPTVRSYMWGLDVTGTVHGGGGVGGLLLTTDGTNHQIPLYDANGNVQGLIDAGDGTLEAVYSYSAFGELLGYANPTGGTYAQDNPIRFASKYCDEYTGLYQYNHRMYSPRLGRFITRDPIGEYGGLNLYAYCRNGPVDDWDYLGLMPDGGLGLVFPPAELVYFAGYVLSKIFSGSPDRPLLNEPTYRETWRAFERYTSRGDTLGRPMTLRHSAKTEGVEVEEAQRGELRSRIEKAVVFEGNLESGIDRVIDDLLQIGLYGGDLGRAMINNIIAEGLTIVLDTDLEVATGHRGTRTLQLNPDHSLYSPGLGMGIRVAFGSRNYRARAWACYCRSVIP
ncbi:MAG: RHS repeat-associated core domain-containing protein [Opitutaceae bacterium]